MELQTSHLSRVQIYKDGNIRVPRRAPQKSLKSLLINMIKIMIIKLEIIPSFYLFLSAFMLCPTGVDLFWTAFYVWYVVWGKSTRCFSLLNCEGAARSSRSFGYYWTSLLSDWKVDAIIWESGIAVGSCFCGTLDGMCLWVLVCIWYLGNRLSRAVGESCSQNSLYSSAFDILYIQIY